MARLDLPKPSAELQAFSAQVCQVIAQEIQQCGGSIGFDRFMQLCLYAPGLGYYSAGLQKFGSKGDFVTAPELGSVYAECWAETLAPVLVGWDHAKILEVGAGTGRLAADLLLALERLHALPEHYWILETSADLRERQIACLELRARHLLPRIGWLDCPPTDAWQGILIGNEIVDALPCQRFEIRDGLPLEIRVEYDGRNFRETLGSAIPLASQRLQSLPETWPDGYRSELQPQLAAWLGGLTERMSRGLVLLADYGYPRNEFYLPERSSGTFVCHFRQRVFDEPFWYPGLVDLSASVDFTALAEAGHTANLELVSYLSQAEFLTQGGLPKVLSRAQATSARELAAVTKQVRTLTLPGEMGERIQLMIFSRSWDKGPLLEVFTRLGWRGRL